VSPRVGALKRNGVLHYYLYNNIILVNYIYIIDFHTSSLLIYCGDS
jgi:tRNA A-37 threonylcarbamoyl transferase component Bud32